MVSSHVTFNIFLLGKHNVLYTSGIKILLLLLHLDKNAFFTFLMPMVTALPFFPTFFLSPIFVYLAKKVNPWCLQIYLFVCLFLSPSFFHYAGNPYSSFLWIWRQYISSLHNRILTTMSLPPHPSALGGGGVPGHSGRRGNTLSVTFTISVTITVLVVPFSVDCCMSPHCHHCCRRCLCCLAAAMAVSIAATAAAALAITAATVITAAINATAVITLVTHNCRHS
jgi:hypothetical protein